MRRLGENNAMAMSAALSFRTIFAMIPTLVLALLVAKSLNALEDTHSTLERIFEATGISQIEIQYEQEVGEVGGGLSGEEGGVEAGVDRGDEVGGGDVVSLADQIQEIADSLESKLTLGRIGPVGAALLIWSALTLMTTIERSLNRIYGARRSRPLHRRVMLYWSALTLGPIALATAVYLARQMTAHLPEGLLAEYVIRGLAWSSEVAVGIVLLGMLYKFMPNTRVSFRSALTAALVAVLLWLGAKWCFSLYIEAVVGKRSLYGALGLLPLFFLWLNFSWLIFLFGAELSNTARNLARMESAERAAGIVLEPTDTLAGAIAVGRPYSEGQGPLSFERLAGALDLPDESVQEIVERLIGREVICPVEVEAAGAGSYVLSRPAERIMLLDVLEIEEREGGVDRRRHRDVELLERVGQVRARVGKAVGALTLADVLF